MAGTSRISRGGRGLVGDEKVLVVGANRRILGGDDLLPTGGRWGRGAERKSSVTVMQEEYRSSLFHRFPSIISTQFPIESSMPVESRSMLPVSDLKSS